MEVRDIRSADHEQARVLLEANGWGRRVADPVVFEKLLANSQRAIVAVEKDQLVGFLRALTDNLSNGYISMVVVAASHRRRGIGRELVAACV